MESRLPGLSSSPGSPSTRCHQPPDPEEEEPIPASRPLKNIHQYSYQKQNVDLSTSKRREVATCMRAGRCRCDIRILQTCFALASEGLHSDVVPAVWRLFQNWPVRMRSLGNSRLLSM